MSALAALVRTPSASWPVTCVDEAALDAVLAAHTMAPRALDRLECGPAVQKRDGHPFRPMVVVSLNDMPMLMSADTARRLAVLQEGRGREGAALDLLGASDMAEVLSHQLQGTMN